MARLDGPIPGENYLGNTKNFPWHRPPEFKKLDDAIEAAAKQLTSEDASIKIVTLLEAGVDVATITDMFLTSGIGAGKWTPDFALIMAGPVAHIIVLMAKGYGIEYDLGVEQKKHVRTKVFLGEMKKINEAKAKLAGQEALTQVSEVQEQSKKQGGFMSAPKPGEEL